MKTRFELEEDINALWSSASDLKTVTEMMYDSDFIYNSDRTFNVLYGLAEVMEAKLGRLEDTFCQVFELNEYAPQAIKDARELALRMAENRTATEREMAEKWNEYFDEFDQQDHEGM